MADNTNKIKRYFLVTIASVLTLQSSQFSKLFPEQFIHTAFSNPLKEQWICHPAKHCQHDDFYGFTKQVGHLSLENLLDQRKFRPVLIDSPPSLKIFTSNREFLSDRLTRPFELPNGALEKHGTPRRVTISKITPLRG